MKKAILLFAFLLVPVLSFAQDYKDFIGTWTGTGKNGGEKGIFLIVKQERDFIKLEVPEDPAWRTDFQNIRIENGMLKYEQINYLEDSSFKEKYGEDHPYSGVVNYCEIWKDENDNMLLRLWTEEMKDVPPVIVTKFNESAK